MSRPTPETDAAWACFKGYMEPLQDVKDLSRKLERERDEARAELEEAQNKLKKTIIELDLASIEIFKWERDFTILANDFKSFVNRIKKQ